MTPEERTHLESALKAAWEDGFKAARHWPNHALPELRIVWNGATVKVVPDWSQRKAGYVG